MAEHCARLCVVIPAFNEEQMIKKAFHTIHRILSEHQIGHSFLFVDDGSADQTWTEIESLAAEHSNVRGICFSRNFGKEAAIHAGLTEAEEFDCCVVIDCDLQHPPETIVEMFRLWEEGYEIIEGVKSKRSAEAAINSLGARTFYSLMSRASGIEMRSASDFKLLDRKAVLTLVNIREKDAFFRALSFWIGYRTTQIEYEVQERTAGQSKWSVKSLTKYAIRNLTSFTSLPLQFGTAAGGICLLAALILGIVSITRKCSGRIVGGTALISFLLLLIGGIILISMGVIGYYLAKVYDEVRQRPVYIISKRTEREHVEEIV